MITFIKKIFGITSKPKSKYKKWFKEFDKAGFVSTADVLAIPHKFKYRQEYGLQMACAAAANSLREQGVTGIRIWSYID